jgi:prophage regulatory protein
VTQPLSSDLILTVHDVVRRTTISRAQIYRMMAQNHFPQPVMLTKQRIGWRESDIARWTRALSAKDPCWREPRDTIPPNERAKAGTNGHDNTGDAGQPTRASALPDASNTSASGEAS